MPYAKYTSNEVAERGEALYEKRLRAQVEAGHLGEFLVLDIETGRLLGRRPLAVVYGLRIGAATAYHVGGHGSRSRRWLRPLIKMGQKN